MKAREHLKHPSCQPLVLNESYDLLLNISCLDVSIAGLFQLVLDAKEGFHRYSLSQSPYISLVISVFHCGVC